MDAIRFFQASTLSPSALADAFNAAFEGYFVPMRHTDDSLATMVRTNDIRLADSLIAETASGDLIGVGLLGARGARGWIGGMAVVPEHRGRGSGAALLSALIERARGLGLGVLQLEVLDQNTAARRLYARLGFVETHPLVVYTGLCTAPAAPVFPPLVSELAVAEALELFAQMHSVRSPWQREEGSLHHMAPALSGLALRDELGVRSYLLWMPSGGGYAILDFGSRSLGGVEPQADALALLVHLTMHDPTATLRAINIPPGDALGDALTAVRCPVVATQREMRLELR